MLVSVKECNFEKMAEAVHKSRKGSVEVELLGKLSTWITKFLAIWFHCRDCGSSNLVAAAVYYRYDKGGKEYRAGNSLVCADCFRTESPASFDPSIC